MESSAVLRSFHCSVGTTSQVRSLLERPSPVPIYNASWPIPSKSCSQGLTVSGKLVFSSTKQKGMVVLSAKTSEAMETSKFDDSVVKGSLEEKAPFSATFPNELEALVLEVCDETEVAELKLKVGDFEMHLKRNIGATKAPMSGISPVIPPPIPTKPMVESAPVVPSPSQSPPKASSPFTNVREEKSSKLAALEASGSGYVLVSSPTVGSFRRGRTVKGKKQPPICKEGDLIKEGQVIGYLDQFGTELPVKSDKAGEVLKLLFDDGEAVGYGDPLIALLPSFHGIE
ncbi:biotin carboxyl carrier protein of acetyl-CoA carboxylase-like [Juglans microcarpa x Juglans regia]|uniref:biotin carboxyl carrier protein of acetyl-CoA carboxylase-like n=1 Tax=Juglans microcarpa x Juglans regia TaxID=2249226 RepID=UPI001B7E98EA|nr:biotin carboxyl carrier protein of acetyl-CoA carboxylase-like [Juglans microcarpa x Juglans regia]